MRRLVLVQYRIAQPDERDRQFLPVVLTPRRQYRLNRLILSISPADTIPYPLRYYQFGTGSAVLMSIKAVTRVQSLPGRRPLGRLRGVQGRVCMS